MPYDDPDATDPLELVGVEIAVDREHVRDMAYAFADEYVRLGFGRKRLLGLFRNARYAASHRAYQVLGEPEVERIIDETVGFWERAHASKRKGTSNTSGGTSNGHETRRTDPSRGPTAGED